MIFKRSTQNVAHSTNHWRIVSSPIISNGKKELVLCGNSGSLPKLTRLDRDKTDQNKNFDQIRRGDMIEWSGGDRVEQKDRIMILKKF